MTVLDEVAAERAAQQAKRGVRDHRDGTIAALRGRALDARRDTECARGQGFLTWAHLLGQEYWAAMTSEEPLRLRRALVRIAAVACAWADAIDRRGSS